MRTRPLSFQRVFTFCKSSFCYCPLSRAVNSEAPGEIKKKKATESDELAIVQTTQAHIRIEMDAVAMPVTSERKH